MMYFAEFSNMNYVFAVLIHLKFDAKWVLALLGSYHLQNELGTQQSTIPMSVIKLSRFKYVYIV